MDLESTIAYKFASLLTDIYKSVEVRNFSSNEDYNLKLSRKFNLDLKKYEHSYIESCRFLLEDTENAIYNFENYGLVGPTKYLNYGESYLRLYGLLNAIYLQISIPIQLIEIFKLDKKKSK